jgi:O-antigen/teichoic acid export membrane protein
MGTGDNLTARRSLGRRWSATAAPYLAIKGAGQAAEMVGWVILARRLGAHSFGILAVAALVCRYGGLIADWGASISGVREVAQGDRWGAVVALERRRRRSALPLAAIYVVAAIVTGHPGSVILVTILLSIGLNRDWVALGREQGARSAFPTLVQGTVLLVLATVGPTSVPTLAASAAYAASLGLSLLLNRLPRPGTGRYEVDSWMMVAILSNQVLSTADTFLLASLASASLAGVYAAVYRLPNGWLALLVILRGGMLAMATTTLRDDPREFLQLRRASLRWCLAGAVALVAAIPLAFVAIPIVFGPAYRSGQWPAVLLLLATAIATAAAPLHHLFLAFGNDRPYGLYLLSAAALNVVANLVLIPVAGMMGAAAATVLANAFFAVVLWRAVHGRMRDAGLLALDPETGRTGPPVMARTTGGGHGDRPAWLDRASASPALSTDQPSGRRIGA